jgi:hypothetical protein
MRTTVLAYVIAAVGLVMFIFGAWGLFVLNNAVDVALTDGNRVRADRRRPCNDRNRASAAPATRHREKYQSWRIAHLHKS